MPTTANTAIADRGECAAQAALICSAARVGYSSGSLAFFLPCCRSSYLRAKFSASRMRFSLIVVRTLSAASSAIALSSSLSSRVGAKVSSPLSICVATGRFWFSSSKVAFTVREKFSKKVPSDTSWVSEPYGRASSLTNMLGGCLGPDTDCSSRSTISEVTLRLFSVAAASRLFLSFAGIRMLICGSLRAMHIIYSTVLFTAMKHGATFHYG